MSDDLLTSGPAGDAVAPGPVRADRDGGAGPRTWGLGWSGVRTVAVLELRQRIRSTRWTAVLVVWVAVLVTLTVLIRWGVRRAYVGGVDGATPDDVAATLDATSGRMTFGVVVFLVLALAGLVAPALSATSINGDRQAGVLATLQTTLLTPAEIVVGKLLAAWVTALALLGAALPSLLWVYLDGGTPLGRLVTTLVVLALTLLVVCAVGLGWSAIASRTSSSAVLTYLTVSLLGPGLPLAFALSVPIVTQVETVQVRTPAQVAGTGASPDAEGCVVVREERPVTRTERSWWLLAPSPFVVVADASPKPARDPAGGDDLLSGIRDAVREARLGPSVPIEACSYSEAVETARQAERDALGATWPAGLAILLALGGGFTVLAVRRLRTPTRRLPAGTRVA